MVTMPCPWCEEPSLVAFRELSDAGAAFTCPDCGTSVEFVEEAESELELAA